MPFVSAKTFIPLPPERVYRDSKDVAALQPYLPNADAITPLELTPERTTHRFEARAAGRRFSWVEVEEWNDATLENRFHSPEGDFDKYEGRYTYAAVEGGTEFGLELDYELEIPLIGGLIKNLIQKILFENVEQLVEAQREVCLARAASAVDTPHGRG